MKKSLEIALGIVSGTVLSVVYLLLAYNIYNGNFITGESGQTIFPVALAGFAVALVITIAVFLARKAKNKIFAFSFLFSSLFFNLVSMIILSNIKFYF